MYEFPARIHLLVLGIGIGCRQAFGQKHAAFDLHQCGRHDKELSRDLEIELLHRMQGVDILARHRLDRNIVDIELTFTDEEEQQVEGPLEDLELDCDSRNQKPRCLDR